MKKIINGKMYNTDTAEEISYRKVRHGGNDFRNLEETLYRKKTGEFFLAGEGGPLSVYRESDGSNGWWNGKGIIPLNEEEVRKWLEDNEFIETYEKYFKVEE